MVFKVKEKQFRIFEPHLGKWRCSAWLDLTTRFDSIRAAAVLKGVTSLKRNLTLCPGTVRKGLGTQDLPMVLQAAACKKFKFILKERIWTENSPLSVFFRESVHREVFSQSQQQLGKGSGLLSKLPSNVSCAHRGTQDEGLRRLWWLVPEFPQPLSSGSVPQELSFHAREPWELAVSSSQSLKFRLKSKAQQRLQTFLDAFGDISIPGSLTQSLAAPSPQWLAPGDFTSLL